MKTYELTYIITPEITLEEAEAKAKEVESSIQGVEGVILRQTSPVPKTLAYPIKNSASGFLTTIEFQLEPEKLKELKKNIAKDGKIVRYMVIIKEALKAQKEKRKKQVPQFTIESREEKQSVAEKIPAEKLELKDIEEKLEEILGE